MIAEKCNQIKDERSVYAFERNKILTESNKENMCAI